MSFIFLLNNQRKQMIKVGLVSLGCAKNLVDSEIMAGHLLKSGMALTPDAQEADVLIVNTCSFIDAAKEESIEAIFEVNQSRGMRKRKSNQKLIVAGCMAQRFAGELQKSMPEVDAFIGLDQVTQVGPIIESLYAKDREIGSVNLVNGKSVYIPDYDTPRFRLTPKHYAYVKIAEGCNHPCSFCVIPQMRGRHRSRTIDSVVREVTQLVSEGVKEINLISQDTTYFGMDRWEQKAGPRQQVDSTRGETLCDLIQAMDQIKGEFWIRILYTHPAHWSDELIQAIAKSKHVIPYIDMPLQHISENMLGLMRRETSREHIEKLIERMRAGIPGLVLRTTFIVGFPGETEEDFDTLLDFIKRVKFERLGVFEYSQEEGSRAAKMEDQLTSKVKKQRWKKAMALQQKLSFQMAESKIDSEILVVVEKEGLARSIADAPEVDAHIYVDPELPVGTFQKVKIIASHEYDLMAEGSGVTPVESRELRNPQ